MAPGGSSESQDARYRSIIDTAVDSIIVIDEHGLIVAANPAAERTFGYGVPEILGRNVSMLMPEPHRGAHDEYLSRYMRTGERRVIGIGREAEGRRKDGTKFPIELSVAEWFSGETRYFTGILRNISDRKEAQRTERRLREELEGERALLRSIVEHLPSGLIIAEAPSGRIVSQNAAADRLLGHREVPVAGREHDAFAAAWPDGRVLEPGEHPLVRAVAEGAEIEQEEIVFTRPDGRRITLLCNAGPVRDGEGRINFAVTTFIDITERRELEARVEHLARHDPLTGLPNRALFAERLVDAVASCGEGGAHSALVLIDLDRFKSVNDTLGHLAGDALLRRVGERIAAAVRQGDTAARIGGDEFAVVLAGVRSRGAVTKEVRRIASTILQPAEIDNHVVEVTASMGYALCPDDADDAGGLMHSADLALYAAKEKGREQVFAFHRGLAEKAARRAAIEGDLRHAIEAGELVLHYQPQVDLATGKVRGVEALVRWTRDGTIVLPGEFIALAETSGTIHRLGAWVTEKACRQQARWREEGHRFTVGINVSPIQATTMDFVTMLDNSLGRAGLDGRAIELEITEGLLLNHDSPSVRAFLGACEEREISLAIDDFGVGYSSLGYLGRLPISKVKIDRSFVSRIGRPDDRSLLGAMIDLGKKLGKRVVAEGVETEEQCRYLETLGEVDGQGFYFARPQPPEALGAWLSGSPEQVGRA